MYLQVNTNGESFLLLNEITDHRCDDSKVIPLTNSFTKSNNNVLSRKHTTEGWYLLVSWKDGSSNWVSLKDLKESYPVEIAEYAKIKGIATEPAFTWGVNYEIREKSAIISKIKSLYWQTTHRYDVRLPKTTAEALRIDYENGDTLWWDAICKEMANVRVAFEEFSEPLSNMKPGFKK